MLANNHEGSSGKKRGRPTLRKEGRKAKNESGKQLFSPRPSLESLHQSLFGFVRVKGGFNMVNGLGKKNKPKKKKVENKK